MLEFPYLRVLKIIYSDHDLNFSRKRKVLLNLLKTEHTTRVLHSLLFVLFLCNMLKQGCNIVD